jgi:MoaA/NifB/PqqE/SkfB family radical SAM enzyme
MDDLVDKDHLGNFWRASPPDALAFHYARDGDHLMVSLFECDYCVFYKICQGERPNLSHKPDKLLMACIRKN